MVFLHSFRCCKAVLGFHIDRYEAASWTPFPTYGSSVGGFFPALVSQEREKEALY